MSHAVRVAAALVLSACAGPEPRSFAEPDPPTYSTPIVLFVSPDSLELQSLRQRLGDDFYVVADDAMWYRAGAYEALDSLGIEYAAAIGRAGRFLVQGRPTLVSWDSASPGWFTLVYDGRTEPRITYDVDLPSLLDSVF